MNCSKIPHKEFTEFITQYKVEFKILKNTYFSRKKSDQNVYYIMRNDAYRWEAFKVCLKAIRLIFTCQLTDKWSKYDAQDTGRYKKLVRAYVDVVKGLYPNSCPRFETLVKNFVAIKRKVDDWLETT